MKDKLYICESCWSLIDQKSSFCNHCGSELYINDSEENKQQNFTLKSKDIEMLKSFLDVMMKSRVVMNDLFRYMKGLTRAYTRGDNKDLSEFLHKAIQDKLK